MFRRHLIWVFAGLFVLFGVLILLTEDPAWRRFWAGSGALSLVGFAVAMVRDALAAGQIRFQNSVIRHAAQPRLFWAAILIVAAAAAGLLIAVLKVLFFKN